MSVHSPSEELTSVIKFKNYGVDLIEVTDDGSGISSEDYDGIGYSQRFVLI